jgi:hypothetical protein
MAQRNPLNQRYQGDGPGGKTKKSAASVKPVVGAASSVHIKNKPTTPQEKRAAAKVREKEVKRKAEDKARRTADKAKAAAAEGVPEEETTAADAKAKAVAPPAKKGMLSAIFGPAPNTPDTQEYKALRKRYWLLLLGGIITIAISFIAQTYFMDVPYLWVATLVLAYAFIIAAFYTDFRKVRPMVKEYQKQGAGVARSPKQQKHAQEAAQRAAQLEAARKAQKAAQRKRPLSRKKTEALVPGEDTKDDNPSFGSNEDTKDNNPASGAED